MRIGAVSDRYRNFVLMWNSFARLLYFGLVLGMIDKKPSIDVLKSEKSLKEASSHDAEQEVQREEKEVGGFENRPEPTRFGDWEVNGRCSDF